MFCDSTIYLNTKDFTVISGRYLAGNTVIRLLTMLCACSLCLKRAAQVSHAHFPRYWLTCSNSSAPTSCHVRLIPAVSKEHPCAHLSLPKKKSTYRYQKKRYWLFILMRRIHGTMFSRSWAVGWAVPLVCGLYSSLRPLQNAIFVIFVSS